MSVEPRRLAGRREAEAAVVVAALSGAAARKASPGP